MRRMKAKLPSGFDWTRRGRAWTASLRSPNDHDASTARIAVHRDGVDAVATVVVTLVVEVTETSPSAAVRRALARASKALAGLPLEPAAAAQPDLFAAPPARRWTGPSDRCPKCGRWTTGWCTPCQGVQQLIIRAGSPEFTDRDASTSDATGLDDSHGG